MMYWGVLLLVVGALAYDPQMYKGYRVVHFTPKTKAQVETALKFGDNKEVLIMKEPRIGRQADYMVSPAQFGPLKAMLYQNGMTFTLNNRDVAGDLQVEWDRMLARGYPEMPYDINDFNTRVDIEDELDRLAGRCADPDVNLICSTEWLPGPQLAAGQRIKAFHMSAGGNPTNSILWESMVHAREWLAGATLMNILHKMINEYATDTDIRSMIQINDFHFIPMMNPDGYQFSWDSDRYWRKNRRDNDGCFGVDINRNFDANWSEPGASGSPCSDTYYGPSAGSEPETQTTVDFVNSITQPPWIMDISVHTYGYYLLAPYGNGTYPPNWATRFAQITADTCDKIEETYNTDWACGNSMDVLYETSGGSTDWMMQVAGMSYSYVPELRGNDFVVNPSQIPFSTEELWNGLKYLVQNTTNAASPKK